MDLISLIKPRNSLLLKQLYSKAFKTLFQELSEFDQKKELLNDLEFLALAMNLTEYIIDQQAKKSIGFRVNKKKLVVDVMVTIYDNLSEQDIENLKNHIQYVYDNGLITKVSTSRYLKKRLSSWISRQF